MVWKAKGERARQAEGHFVVYSPMRHLHPSKLNQSFPLANVSFKNGRVFMRATRPTELFSLKWLLISR